MINILLALKGSQAAALPCPVNKQFIIANNGCQVLHKYFKLRAKFMKILKVSFLLFIPALSV